MTHIDHTVPEIEQACEIILQVTKPGCLHKLSALRPHLHGISRAAQDAAILTLAKAGHLSLHRVPNSNNVTDEDRSAAFLAAGIYPRHYVGRMTSNVPKAPQVAYSGRYHADKEDSTYREYPDLHVRDTGTIEAIRYLGR